MGDVSQHMEYFAFGETFIEEHKNSHNSPYKFNGKELDEESGYTYYGARYLDMRYSIWTSTDPLSGYNPIFEVEHYIDGQHNGGVLNSFNLNTYGYCYQNPINLVDPNGKQTFVAGKPFNPGFKYDSGYSKFPKETPTYKDRLNYSKWYAKGVIASKYPLLADAGKAYLHYMDGTGKNRTFNFNKYLENDSSGKTMLANATAAAKSDAQRLFTSEGKYSMTSEGFSASFGNAKYPYPATENWQKTVGAFNAWMSADVKVEKLKNGNLSYTMNLTINAEDMYNFNPGQSDIATGTPDSENGRFEVVGFAKQYMNKGSYTKTYKWIVKPKKTKTP